MKIAIIGSRGFTDFDLVQRTVDLTGVTEIISGGARGADALAERLAIEHGIKLTVYQADWKTLGFNAGHIRNSLIVDAADVIIAYWDGVSTGTLDSIKKARKAGKPCIVHEYTRPTLEF